jgi:hypothetical protein
MGGLSCGYLGAHLEPHLPDKALRLLLASLAIGVGALHALQALL